MRLQTTIPLLFAAIIGAMAAWVHTTLSWQAYTRNLVQFYGQEEAEMTPFRQRYEPSHSGSEVEWLVRDFFADERRGVFLDVGANHFQRGNNTFYLETQLGWSGVAVDALPEFAADYLTRRRRTKFVTAFVADRGEGQVTFFVPDSEDKGMASQSEAAAEKWGARATAMQVPTVTINGLLERAGIAQLDFVSIDIELAEPAALKGFDIDRYRPRLVCIEAHPDVRQFILDYFHSHGYRVIGKYLRADTHNLYFTR